MYDPLSIQIHNRSEFENNIDNSVWLKLPADTEQLHAAMRQVNITADNQQDFFINGIDTPIEAVQRIPFENVQSAGVDELNYLAAALRARDDRQMEKLNAAVEYMTDRDDIHSLVELTQNTGAYDFHPDIFSNIQLGEHTLEYSGLIQIPEEWEAAIDVEMLGQLAAANEKGVFTEYGYIVPNGEEWEPVTEIPQEYRIMSFPEAAHPKRGDNNIIYDEIATRTPVVAVATPPAQEQAEPQPVKPIMLESEKPADKLKEITDKLESGIAGIFESDQYKDYLKTLSKFHNYSLNNTILIAMQKPDATRIAGFSAWKSNFERNVRKGEKGIKILAPSPFKMKKEMEKIDPTTQRPVVGKDGKPVTEEVEITIPAFKVVSVFDVSQTEGKELPNIGVNMLTGSVEQYKDFFAALEKASPVPIAFENIERSANGYYHLEDKRIAIKEGMSELQTLKTAIHEIAHARLHDIDVNNKKDEQPRADSRTREVEAESIAYTVCQHYELDTSEYSFGYVAGWSSGKELTELKASLETIRTAAAELIAEIDGHFAEHWQDKEQAAEQERQPGYEKWSEPATAENAPDNPGVASDDINAYLPQHDTFSIYQLKQGDSTRDMRFEPLDRLQAAGQSIDRSNYELVYTAPISEDTGNLEKIFEKFNIDHPQDFTGHSLSVSDIVTLNRDGQEAAHYVDSFGFKEVPEFLRQPEKPFDMQQTAAEPPEPDNFLTGEKIKTPRGSFSLTNMTTAQMEAAGYGFHHNSDDDKYHIMGNGTRAFAIANENNPLRTAEMSTEQNYNMIDGIPNNRPTVDELEKQVKAGQTISLLDLAHAVKAEQRGDTGRDSDKKPSILAQLAEGKAAAAPKKAAAKTQSNDLEV